jgi:hypothetical protein
LLAICVFFLINSPIRSEENNSSVWLGFTIFGRDQQPAEINLAKDQLLDSAFLSQLKRQALLIAARDELGVQTFDEFIGEAMPTNGVVKIDNIKRLSSTDVPYNNHLQYLIDLEKCTRNEIVVELKKLGVKKNEDNESARTLTSGKDIEEECAQIEKLLNELVLIPQFEAVRRTHRLIHKTGETPKLLTFLVRGYTQLQLLTNINPIDIHRVFQARAMLYAQRIIAKYGETSEHISLRAAAWSLNNFHSLARQDFAKTSTKKQNTTEPKNIWIEFAKCYAEFDFKGLEKQIEAADKKTEQPLGKLLRFFLLDYAYERVTLARPYGETIIEDLPDCSRLYLGLMDINDFDMIYAPDGSLFYEHLARRISPAIKKMELLPDNVLEAAKKLQTTVKKSSSTTLFSNLFGGNTTASQHFPLAQYYRDLATLLNALSTTTSETKQEYSEPSLSMLSFILKDNEFHKVSKLAYGERGHNGIIEKYLIPAMPVIDDHPDVEFLGLSCHDRSLGSSFWHRLKAKKIPYNLFTTECIGFNKPFFDTDFNERIYSPYYIANLFADRENIRDMLYYHGTAKSDVGNSKYYFLVDHLYNLCPKKSFCRSSYARAR